MFPSYSFIDIDLPQAAPRLSRLRPGYSNTSDVSYYSISDYVGENTYLTHIGILTRQGVLPGLFPIVLKWSREAPRSVLHLRRALITFLSDVNHFLILNIAPFGFRECLYYTEYMYN